MYIYIHYEAITFTYKWVSVKRSGGRKRDDFTMEGDKNLVHYNRQK